MKLSLPSYKGVTAPVISGILWIVLSTQFVSADTATITFNFTGRVTTLQDSSNFLGGAVGVGDSITGSFTFTLSAIDTNPGDFVFSRDREPSNSPHTILLQEAAKGRDNNDKKVLFF